MQSKKIEVNNFVKYIRSKKDNAKPNKDVKRERRIARKNKLVQRKIALWKKGIDKWID